MNRLLVIITSAIATILGYKKTIAALTAENASLRESLDLNASTIEDLRNQVAFESDDTQKEEALQELVTASRAVADEAKAKATELQAMLDEADQAASELAKVINEHPETPVIDDGFAVVNLNAATATPVNTATDNA